MMTVNKRLLAIAICALDNCTTNERSDFVIKNYTPVDIDSPVIANIEFSGKKGKKGKYLKDWEWI